MKKYVEGKFGKITSKRFIAVLLCVIMLSSGIVARGSPVNDHIDFGEILEPTYSVDISELGDTLRYPRRFATCNLGALRR